MRYFTLSSIYSSMCPTTSAEGSFKRKKKKVLRYSFDFSHPSTSASYIYYKYNSYITEYSTGHYSYFLLCILCCLVVQFKYSASENVFCVLISVQLIH